jgi:hypothetical protein
VLSAGSWQRLGVWLAAPSLPPSMLSAGCIGPVVGAQVRRTSASMRRATSKWTRPAPPNPNTESISTNWSKTSSNAVRPSPVLHQFTAAEPHPLCWCGAGHNLPLLIRFDDILADRIRLLNEAFAHAIAEHKYANVYRGKWWWQLQRW